MPMDFAQSRVRTENLNSAISSEDVNATGTALTIETIRNYDRSIRGGLSQFGQGIAAGINTRTNREENALERATAMRANQLRQTDMDQRQGADSLRAHARTVPLEQLARENLGGGALPSVSELSRRGVEQTFGPNMPYEAMSPGMRSQVDALTQAYMGKRALVHTGAPGAERQFGKHGDPDYTGQHPSEALEQGVQEYHESLRKLQTSDPVFRKDFVELADRRESVQRARDRRQYEVAGYIEQNPGDKRGEAAAREMQSRWDSDEAMPFTNGRRTLKDATLGVKPEQMAEFAAKNMAHVEAAWPRLGLEKTAGGKTIVKSEFDDGGLKGMGDTEKKVMQRYLGTSIHAAHGALSGWRASDKVLRHVISGGWAKTPEQKSAQATMAKMVNSGDVAKEEARAHLVNMLGWGDVDAQLFEGQLGGGKGQKFLDRMNEARRLSPEFDHVFFRGEEGSGTGEADEVYQAEYEKGIDQNQVITRPGPLAFMLEDGYSTGEVAQVLQSFKETTTRSPYFAGFQNHLLSMGLGKKDAARAAQELYPDLERRINGITRTFTAADGRTFNDFSRTEQEIILKGVAEDLARPFVREGQIKSGAESRSASAALAGRAEPLLSLGEAKRMTDAAIKTNPKMGEGQSRLQIGSGLEIHVERGEAKYLLRKGKDGKTETIQFADQQPDAVDIGEAFSLAREIFKKGGEAPRRGLSIMGADVFDTKVSGFFDMKLGGGATAYQWAHARLGGREAATSEDVRALRDGISRYAAEQGMTEFDLKQRFADAALYSEDPVVDGLAIFMEQVLSPRKDTVQDLRAMEGESPGPMLKSMGDKAYREGDPNEGGQPPASGGGFAQVFQEGAVAAAARQPAPQVAAPSKSSARGAREVGEHGTRTWMEPLFGKGAAAGGVTEAVSGGVGSLFETVGQGMVAVEDVWKLWNTWRKNEPPSRHPGYLKQKLEGIDKGANR